MQTNNQTKKIEYPLIKLKGEGELIIPENVQKRINMLHSQVGATEWCGFITYDKVEGNINDPSTYVAKVKDVYPMNIGSSTYTESDNHSSELKKMDDRIPSYFASRTGLIHTHHNMKAYFSTTDIQELHNNVDKYDGNSYYLSLIVNFEKKYVAKIVKLVDIPANKAVYKEDKEEHSIEFPSEKAMMMFDLNVKIEEEIVWDDEILQTRIDELKAEVLAKKEAEAKKQFSPTTGNWFQNYQAELGFNNSRKSYSAYLRSVLECSADPKKEIGQSLTYLTTLKPDDFDTAMDLIEEYINSTVYDTFGLGNMVEGLNKTANILKSYKGAPKWKSEVEHLLEVFNDVTEDMAVFEINKENSLI